MVTQAPMPPLPLANRVGSLADAEDPYAFYQEVGADTRKQILRMLPSGYELEGRRLLDFGCGAGRTLRHFLGDADSAEIWGCDIDEESIAWLQRNLCPPLHAVRNEAAPGLPFEDGHFDLIWALSVFTHLPDDAWAAWLLELHRLLGDDGILIATSIGPHHSEVIAKEPWDEERIAMNALRHWTSWDEGGPMVLHSNWWLHAHWGRAFEILQIDESPEEMALSNHRWLAMRKRDVTLTVEELERPEPDEPRELTAGRHLTRQLRGELEDAHDLIVRQGQQLRVQGLQLDRAREASLRSKATIAGLHREIAGYRDSRSWRMMAPGRWLGRQLRRLLGRSTA